MARSIPLILALLLAACGPKAPQNPYGSTGVTTAYYPDHTKTLPRSNLTALAQAVGTATAAADVGRRVSAYAGGFRTLPDIERAYFTVLTYKYWRQAGEPTNFAKDFGALEQSGAPALLNQQLHGALANLGAVALPQTFGMLGGLHQFGLDGSSEERNEEIRDSLYWGDERRALSALVKTNLIDRYFLPGFSSNRQMVYELPVTNVASLYIYERTGTTWNFFKGMRAAHLAKLRLQFPPADRWIFTNTNWADLDYKRGDK